VAFKRQVDGGVEQRVARANEGGERLALRRDQGFLEGDALVARQIGSPRPITRSRLRTRAGTWVTS
jgi:hypothetical protein